tara:strand:- start:5231 stop:6415 length:1185 start_codon:yes stop_codon:yes gene_type:complete
MKSKTKKCGNISNSITFKRKKTNLVVDQLFKENIEPVYKFKKSLLEHKKKIDRLKQSCDIIHLKDEETHDLILFRRPTTLKVSISKNIKLPITYTKSKYITEGSYNTVCKVENSNIFKGSRAIRFTSNPIQSVGDNIKILIDEIISEAELTLRLEGLGITPKIHDIFFAKKDCGIILVVISDIAKYGNVTSFLSSNDFNELDNSEIKHLGDQTVKLYSRMIENEILCTDIKTNNMVVLKGKNGYEIKNIDFDNQFCSSKISKITFDDILNQVRDPKSPAYIRENVNSKYIKKLLLCLSLLQVSLVSWKNDKQKLFVHSLIEVIKIKYIPDMAKLAHIQIGDGSYTFDGMFSHYYSSNIKLKYCDHDTISTETAIIGAMAIALYGSRYKSKYCVP